MKCVGIVMTNQPRKDWSLAAVVCAMLAERLKGEIKFWWHVDTPLRYWNLYALISDFGLGELVELTQPPVDDKWLAEQYRACDLTLLPSLGEGFGFSWAESVACGVRCLHGDYAGGASLMHACGLGMYLIQPVAWRLEGEHNCLRPVFNPEDWMNQAMDCLANEPTQQDREWLASRVGHLSYMKLGHVWQRWFREGLGDE